MPKVALAPIFILWFRLRSGARNFADRRHRLFPVAIDMLAGLQSGRAVVRCADALGRRQQNRDLRRVQIPHSLPHLMAGLKVAITFSVIGAIVGEFAGASAGLGYVIQFASTQLETPLVFAALVVVSVVGLVFTI